MNAFQTLLYVMIPQTFRNVLPTLTSEFILLYKDTSLLAAVGVVEIVMNARTIVPDGLHYAVCGCRPVLSGHYSAACSLGERSRGEAAGYGRNQKEASHQERRTGCRDARRPYRWSVRRFYHERNQ